ncbi:hypothetical protein [Candidatus Accumulibacter sp. ACC007]|uniref:hypothetical protein n=1 Tax=Candidatus Accumulibacter sp. ACC007 TaxID=2823333 RepID=UPI0025C6B2A9|nr:hypothetical protein [Candidatus Accumulibacter sp. ACC007]
MDKVIRVVFALAVLASAASVFYYYAIFLPGIEQERQTKIEAEKLSEARRVAEEKILAEVKAAEKGLYVVSCGTGDGFRVLRER